MVIVTNRVIDSCLTNVDVSHTDEYLIPLWSVTFANILYSGYLHVGLTVPKEELRSVWRVGVVRSANAQCAGQDVALSTAIARSLESVAADLVGRAQIVRSAHACRVARMAHATQHSSATANLDGLDCFANDVSRTSMKSSNSRGFSDETVILMGWCYKPEIIYFQLTYAWLNKVIIQTYSIQDRFHETT